MLLLIPNNDNIKNGDMNMPIRFPIALLKIAAASSPCDDFVTTITALIAMGKQLHMIMP